MKKRKLLLCGTALLALSVLSGCGKGNTDDTSSASSTPSSSSSSQTGTMQLLQVMQKTSFTNYLTNRSVDKSLDGGFLDNDEPYYVGDDNAFSVLPKVVVKTGSAAPTTSENAVWQPGFTISAVKEGTPTTVDSTVMEVVDPVKCLVKFKDAAIGNSYTITVTANETQAQQKSQSFTVKVVDGYNAYNPVEIAYLDTRGEDTKFHGVGGNWKKVLRANNLPVTNQSGAYISYDNMVFHNDMIYTKDNVPSEFFYTQAEATAKNLPAIAGAMKDWATVVLSRDDSLDLDAIKTSYEEWEVQKEGPDPVKEVQENSRTIKVYGNYYRLDFSALPTVEELTDNDTKIAEKPISHANFFVICDGSLDLVNLNVTGNAPRSENTKLGGGLIFTKCNERSYKVNVSNVLNRSCFISYMSSQADKYYAQPKFYLDKAKCTNAYNSFLYNWASEMYVSNSYFGGAGGPVCIQDHHCEEDIANYDVDENGVEVKGVAPVTEFTDCTFENYVSGSEAWFIQMGADAYASSIVALNQLIQLASTGGLSYIKTFDVNGANIPMFNFVVVNKSASAQSATNIQCSGEAKFINTTKGSTEVYNYARYTAEQRSAMQTEVQTISAAVLALGAAQQSQDMQALTEAVTTIVTLAMQYGLNPDMAKVMTQDVAEITRLAYGLEDIALNLGVNLSAHKEIVRGVPAIDAQAAVFQTNTSYAYTASATSLATPTIDYATGTQNPAGAFDGNCQFIKNAGDYITIYVSGMMVVITLDHLA